MQGAIKFSSICVSVPEKLSCEILGGWQVHQPPIYPVFPYVALGVRPPSYTGIEVREGKIHFLGL